MIKGFVKIIRGSAALSLSQFGSKLVGFLLLPFFTFYLDAHDFGVIALFSLITSVLAMTYNSGLSSIVMRNYYDCESANDERELYSNALFIGLTIPIIVLVISLFFGRQVFDTGFKELSYYPYGVLAFIFATMAGIRRLFEKKMIVDKTAERLAIHSSISVIIGISISVILIKFFQFDAMGRVIGMMVAGFYIFIVSVYSFFKVFNIRLISKKKLSSLFRESSALGPAVWAFFLLNIGDRYIIEHFLGLSDLGMYTVAYTLGATPFTMALAGKALWSAKFFEFMKARKHHKIKLIQELMNAAVVLIFIFCVFILLPISHLLINENFHQSLKLITLISAGISFSVLYTIPSSFLSYRKEFSRISLIAVISAIFNIGFNLIVVSDYGITGIAFGTLLSYFLYMGLAFISDAQKNPVFLNYFQGSIFYILVIFMLAWYTYVFGSKFQNSTFIGINLGLVVILALVKVKKFKEYYRLVNY